MDFKKKNSLEKRKAEALRILDKYPDRIPVVITRSKSEKLIPDIDKNKFLVPKDISVGQLIYVIRKRIKIEADKSIFLFFNDTLPQTSMLLSELYERYKDEDSFIYGEFSGQSVFGNF